MENVKKSITAASLIGAMFSMYSAGELNSSGELVRKRIRQYMSKRAKCNHKEYIEIVLKTDGVWQDAINHFAKEKLRIEAKSTIRAIYNYFEDVLSKYANIRSEHIEKLMINATDDAEAEHNSDMVVDYIVERLGLPKRKSAFKTRLAIMRGNRILEGKDARS